MTSRTEQSAAPNEVLKMLEQMPLFYDFGHEEVKKIAAIAKEAYFEPRQTVYRTGDPGDRIYLLVSGLVRLAPRDDEETTPEDFIVRSRNVFGEDCACDDSPRGMSAQALMRTHCLLISRDGLRRLEEQHPRVALKLLRKFARTTGQRLRQAVGTLARIPGATAGHLQAPTAITATVPTLPVRSAFVDRTIGHLERALATFSTVRKPRAV